MQKIRLIDTGSGAVFRFPDAVTQINRLGSTRFYNYEMVNRGEVRHPKGERVSEISITGLLPGKKRAGSVAAYTPPNAARALWDRWRQNGTRLRLSIGGVMSIYVYLKEYTVKLEGGFGDAFYTLTLITARPIRVTYQSAAAVSAYAPAVRTRYTATGGESLYRVARAVYGDGAQWARIYEANREAIGDVGALAAGTVLVIP